MQKHSRQLSVSLLIQVLGQLHVFFHLVTNEVQSCFNSSFTQTVTYNINILIQTLNHMMWGAEEIR